MTVNDNGTEASAFYPGLIPSIRVGDECMLLLPCFIVSTGSKSYALVHGNIIQFLSEEYVGMPLPVNVNSTWIYWNSETFDAKIHTYEQSGNIDTAVLRGIACQFLDIVDLNVTEAELLDLYNNGTSKNLLQLQLLEEPTMTMALEPMTDIKITM